jgi:hypothetical protein
MLSVCASFELHRHMQHIGHSVRSSLVQRSISGQCTHGFQKWFGASKLTTTGVKAPRDKGPDYHGQVNVCSVDDTVMIPL